MRVKVEITDIEETIKLIDEANSLIERLRNIVLRLDRVYVSNGIDVISNNTAHSNDCSSFDNGSSDGE